MDLKHRSRGITDGRDRVPARSMFKANRRRTRWRHDPLRRQPGILEVEISDEVLRERIKEWRAPKPRYLTGVFAKSAALVSSASQGASAATKMNWFF
jgi:hypothetical protein